MVCNIFLEGRCGFVFAAFCLNGNDFRAILQNKIDLIVLVCKIAWLNLKLTAKLLQNIVFGQGTLELIISLQEDCAVVYACHVLEQSGVKNKEFELIELVKSRKRMLHLGNIVDTIKHTG